MNKKIIIGILIVILLVGSILFFMLREKEPEPILIGAILPLSGSGASLGHVMQNGMLLAIQEINDAGGINGRRIELVIEDSKTEAEEAKKAFAKIESEVRPLLYISTFSGIGKEVGPLAEEEEVVMIVMQATSDKVTEGKKWVYKYPQSAVAEIAPALFHFENLNVKHLGILYINDEYGQSLEKEVGSAFEEIGGVVESISHETDEYDFQPYIDQLADTDAMYFLGFAPQYNEFYLRAKASGYAGNIMGDSSLSTNPEIATMEGVYYAESGFNNPNFIFAREASRRYEAVYGEPMVLQSGSSYDIMHVLADLLEQEELSRKNVQYVLDQGFTFSGILGEINVLPGEHNIIAPLYPVQVVNGTLEYLQ